MSEESVEGRNFLQMQILHWSGISNVQISFTDFGVWLKKGSSSLSNCTKTYNNPLHIFPKEALPSLCCSSLRKRQAFTYTNEMNGEQMHSTPVMTLQQLWCFSIQAHDRRILYSRTNMPRVGYNWSCTLRPIEKIWNIRARNEPRPMDSYELC